MWHSPALHTGEPFSTSGQTVPQEPQLFGSLARSVPQVQERRLRLSFAEATAAVGVLRASDANCPAGGCIGALQSDQGGKTRQRTAAEGMHDRAA
jgi:hypothetical protein